MAKKRRRMAKKAVAVVEPNITPGVCIGSYGSSTIWADKFSKLWHFDIIHGTARPIKVVISDG